MWDGPYIAMTFDDGPSSANTPRLLDLLAKMHIKATFFLIGQNVAANPQIAKRIHDEGHEIGNHTWTHPVLSSLSDDKVRSELQQTDDAIFKAIGIHPTLMRPPYGSLAIAQRKWINKDFGYKIVLWDVDPNDWKVLPGETPEQRTARVENVILNGDKEEHGARNGSIILSHDIHKTTVDAMADTLGKLQAKGFKFVTVSELIAMDKPVPPKAAGDSPKKDATASPAPQAAVSGTAAAGH